MKLFDKILLVFVVSVAILLAFTIPKPRTSPWHFYLLGVSYFKEDKPTAIKYWQICTDMPVLGPEDEQIIIDCQKAIITTESILNRQYIQSAFMNRWANRKNKE